MLLSNYTVCREEDKLTPEQVRILVSVLLDLSVIICPPSLVCSCLATKILTGQYLPTERVVVSEGWGNGLDRQQHCTNKFVPIP